MSWKCVISTWFNFVSLDSSDAWYFIFYAFKSHISCFCNKTKLYVDVSCFNTLISVGSSWFEKHSHQEMAEGNYENGFLRKEVNIWSSWLYNIFHKTENDIILLLYMCEEIHSKNVRSGITHIILVRSFWWSIRIRRIA